MIKVVVTDDHDLIRFGLIKLIEQESDIQIAGECKSGSETLEIIKKVPCDVLLLDIELPDRNGIEILKDLKILKPKLPVLIMTMHDEQRFALRTIKAGASGYLNKDQSSAELIKAIRKVASGGKYLTPAVAEKLAEQYSDENIDSPVENLSDREFEVLRLMASGFTQVQIADKLCLSLSTINTYRSRLLEKLNLSSNAQLIHFAITNNLVD